MKPFYLTLFFIFALVTSAAAAIDINTGTLAELTSLPGIGPVKAEAIIKYREEKGRFTKLEELKNVHGIGEKIVERIKGDIIISDTAKAVANAGKKGAAEKIATKQTASATSAKK